MQEYIKTDQQIHWLSQAIAKVNRTYVKQEEDDSHTNLYFDPLSRRILGRWVDSPAGRIILVLDLNSFRFHWLDHQMRSAASAPGSDASVVEIERELAEYPASLGMDTNGLFRKLHFQIPEYKINRIAEEDFSMEGIRQWTYYRELANEASLSLLGYLQAQSEIRIWPHHFDTGIYIQLSPETGLGFGLAMKDSMIGEPYFYMAAYSGEGSIAYDQLPELSHGRWITGEDWKGAVLPLGDIPLLAYEQAKEVIGIFIMNTSEWFVSR